MIPDPIHLDGCDCAACTAPNPSPWVDDEAVVVPPLKAPPLDIRPTVPARPRRDET